MSSFISAPYIVFRDAEFFIPDRAFVLYTVSALLKLFVPFLHALTDAWIPVTIFCGSADAPTEEALHLKPPDEKNPAATEAGWWRARGCAQR